MRSFFNPTRTFPNDQKIFGVSVNSWPAGNTVTQSQHAIVDLPTHDADDEAYDEASELKPFDVKLRIRTD